MKKAIAVLALVAAFIVVGCGGGDTSSTTTSTTPELTAEQVEGYFAADRSKRAARVGNATGGIVSVVDESCTIQEPGTATCIEKLNYQIGGYTKDETLVWNVTYSEDGEILTYTK